MSRSKPKIPLVVAAFALVALVLAILSHLRRRREPQRCAQGLHAVGGRCCGEGQTSDSVRCIGRASHCSPQQRLDASGHCVVSQQILPIAGGRFQITPIDWDGSGTGGVKPTQLAPFRLDQYEVTVAHWEQCVLTHACKPLTDAFLAGGREPGAPVTQVSPEEAEAYCRYAKGHLPSSAQWLFTAAGHRVRRYAWGDNGLVCRRAVFGLITGPCAQDGHGPEVPGSRRGGASPEGVFDLIGNVAEWTLEGENRYVARGGSFQSKLASGLKSWALEDTQEPAPHIGFRCAYPSSSPLESGPAETP